MGEYPRITADLNKIRHNLNALIALCSEYGVSIAAVGKVVCTKSALRRWRTKLSGAAHVPY